MFSNIEIFKKALFALVCSLGGMVVASSDCGFRWEVPSWYIDGCDDSGYVSYNKVYGSVVLESGTKIPVISNFHSKSSKVSRALGRNWYFPLIEANVVKVDEDVYRAEMPDGYWYGFRRVGESNVFKGNRGFVGEEDGRIFRVVSSCGAGAVFVSGELAEISLKGGEVLKVERSEAGSAVRVVDGGAGVDILGFEHDGESSLLKFGGEQIVFSKVSDGVQVRGSGLNELYSRADGASVGLLSIESSNSESVKITWDSKSKKIVSLNSWLYAVDKGEAPRVVRTRGDEVEEYWRSKTGSVFLKGAETERFRLDYFTIGGIQGKLKKISSVDSLGNEIEVLMSVNYDYATGKLIGLEVINLAKVSVCQSVLGDGFEEYSHLVGDGSVDARMSGVEFEARYVVDGEVWEFSTDGGFLKLEK